MKPASAIETEAGVLHLWEAFMSFFPQRAAHRLRFFTLAIIALLVLGVAPLIQAGIFAASAPADPQLDPLDKIAPWVIAHTAGGQQAEFLVLLADQADLSAAAQLSSKIEKGRYVYHALYAKAQATQGSLLKWLAERGVEHRAYYIVNLIWVKADRDTALALAARSDVARLEGNPQVRSIPEPITEPVSSAPGSPDAVELGITYTKAPQVWAMGFTGQGIVVGGQDTGIQWDHPALKNHYRGWNGTTANHDYNWHDSIHTNSHGDNPCGVNSPAPCDDDGHGTHTIGTAIGDDGSTNQIGMAPGAKFIGCRNMDNGYGTPATYIECFEFFLAPYPVGGTPAQGNPDLAPDVTNNSWGCPPSEGCVVNSLLQAVQAQRAAGIMTVVSAGNSGPLCSTTSAPPSYHDEVYTVGNINAATGTIASTSSRGPATTDGSGRLKPDITAPGTSVRSAYPPNSYVSISGTSMAGPHVVGAVALLWSARPALKNNLDLTEQLLNQAAVHVNNDSCDPPGTTWPNNTYGYGRLDIKVAVDLAPLTDSVLIGVVTDTVTAAPIANTAITATASLTMTGYTSTTATGAYMLPLISGTYTVSATAYGYQPEQITGVAVVSTTMLNITLTPTLFYTVSGTVKDALAGWPLSATITITGYPGGPISTDANGLYAVSLAEGVIYSFRVAANVNGYNAATRTIGPLSADRLEDFTLEPDLVTCAAPGYTLLGLGESFSTSITPTHWTVSGTPAGWRFTNPGGRANLTGGAGGLAIADSDYAGPGVSMNTELRTSSLDFSALPTVKLRFKTHFAYYSGGTAEVADVDVSADGGVTWNNVWRRTTGLSGPSTQEIDISALAAGQPNVLIRFHYYNATFDGYWEVDDVHVGQCMTWFSGLSLAASVTEQTALSGQIVTYTLHLTNTGNVSGTYHFSTTGSTWPTHLPPDIVLDAGGHVTAAVLVDIPAHAPGGTSDTAQVRVNLVDNPAIQRSLTLTTMVETVYGFDWTAPQLAQSGYAGMSITYTLRLTNTGNVSSTFHFSVTERTWPTHVPPDEVLAAGARTAVAVIVDIPAGAARDQSDAAGILINLLEHSAIQHTVALTTTAQIKDYLLYFPFITH
jgi:subtilisin family serine protease